MSVLRLDIPTGRHPEPVMPGTRQACIMLGMTDTVSQLLAAMRNRKAIGQAIGIVMERYGLDEARRHQVLSRTFHLNASPTATLRRTLSPYPRRASWWALMGCQ